MVGILCEKASAARNFAKALGGMSGTYNGEQYEIVNAAGHLYELLKPNEQVSPELEDQYYSWDLENLPWNENDIGWKYKATKDSKDLLSNIKRVLGQADECVIGGDLDPTGEGFLLQAEIFLNLGLKPKKISRMYFFDEAEKTIQDAFRNRKTVPSIVDFGEYKKGFYRARWDFMSMQFTRIATKSINYGTPIRMGRLKSAMVLLVGDQLKAVAEYKKVPSYQNRFKDENGVVYTNPDEPTFPKPEDVPQIYNPSDVVVDSKTMKKTAPPKLLDLAGLSSIMASKGYKPDMVLETYQKMYEAQVVSYPRTEDKTVSVEQFNELLTYVDKIADVVGVDKALLTHRQPRPTHVKNGGAHGANRPGTNVPSSLDKLDSTYGQGAKEIYEILAKNYLSILAEDYEYEHQVGHIKDYPDFKGKSNVPVKLGFKAIFVNDYEEEKKEDEEEESNKGLGTHAEPFTHEGFPPKPQTPTMSWLMKQLEKHDVGTGATRTSTFAEMTNPNVKSSLMTNTKGKIGFTDCGKIGYYLLPNTHIGDIEITKRVQAEMKAIENGEANADSCLSEIRGMVIDDIKTMTANAQELKARNPKLLAEGAKKTVEIAKGTYNGDRIQGYKGKDISFFRVISGHRLTDEEMQQLLNGDTIDLYDCKMKDGTPYTSRGYLGVTMKDGKYQVNFIKLGVAGCDEDGFPSQVCGHTFTDDEKTRLKNGETVHFGGLQKKDGGTFAANVSWKNKKFNFEFDMPSQISGHVFTEDEKTRLKNGEPIFFENLTKKDGGTYSATLIWNGSKFQFGMPNESRGHKFTEEEKGLLKAGKTIEVKDCISQAGKTYGGYFKWNEKTSNIEFTMGIADSWSGHTFTAEEKKVLLTGKKIKLDDCVSSKTGNTFSCELYRDKKTGKLTPIFNKKK